MAQLSLYQLLDEAIGTPELGAVNFMALRSLLLAMLGHLGLRDLPAQKQGDSLTLLWEGDQPAEAPPVLEKEGDRAQDRGQQPQEPGQWLPGKDLLQESTSSPPLASVATDVGWMRDKIKANESGISKVEALAHPLGAPLHDTPSSGAHAAVVLPPRGWGGGLWGAAAPSQLLKM